MALVDLTSVGRSHSFQLAEALDELGLLRYFHTGVVVPNEDSRVLDRLAAALPGADQQRLAKRRSPLPASRVRPVPSAELFEQGGRRLFRRFNHRPWNYAASVYFDAVVAARVRRNPPRIVHAFEHSALYTLRAARKAGAITVLEQPIIHIDTYLALEEQVRARTNNARLRRAPGWRAHIERKRKEYALADYCIVGLPTARDTMIAGGFTADRIFVTPYGVPRGWNSNADAQPRTNHDPLRVLFVGHVDFYKGLDVVLDAFDQLPPGFELTILGVVEEAWADYFMRRIKRMPRVSYRTPVPSSEMPAIYASHDVLAFPSLVGGIGFAVFEAIASGLVAVLPTDEGILTDGTDCVVASLDDPASWANALVELRDDPARFKQLSANGIARSRDLARDSYLDAVRCAYDEIARREGLEK